MKADGDGDNILQSSQVTGKLTLLFRLQPPLLLLPFPLRRLDLKTMVFFFTKDVTWLFYRNSALVFSRVNTYVNQVF